MQRAGEGLMVGVFGEKVMLSQANGPDVSLIVRGTELYGTYQTTDGFPVIYDDSLGLFCYARIVAGEFQSTGVPSTSSPPPDVERHATESDEVRVRKIDQRTRQLAQRAPVQPKEGGKT
jgi:hypothetical protein